MANSRCADPSNRIVYSKDSQVIRSSICLRYLRIRSGSPFRVVRTDCHRRPRLSRRDPVAAPDEGFAAAFALRFASVAFAIWTAATAFYAVVGTTQVTPLVLPKLLLPLLLLAAIYFLMNTWLVALALAFERRVNILIYGLRILRGLV